MSSSERVVSVTDTLSPCFLFASTIFRSVRIMLKNLAREAKKLLNLAVLENPNFYSCPQPNTLAKKVAIIANFKFVCCLKLKLKKILESHPN